MRARTVGILIGLTTAWWIASGHHLNLNALTSATGLPSVGSQSQSRPVRAGTVPAAYVGLIDAAGRRCALITPAVLAAQINQESGFDPNSVSSTGAEGIAQFEPGTAASWGVDPWDPASAIDGMARMDCSNANRFGSLSDALAAYNAGPGAVTGGYWQQIGQTRDYVASIEAAIPSYESR
jgi:soluble lytic murein transglycosylase-like protein